VVPPVEPEPLPEEDPELPVPVEDPDAVGFFLTGVFFTGFFGAVLGVLVGLGAAIGVGAVTVGSSSFVMSEVLATDEVRPDAVRPEAVVTGVPSLYETAIVPSVKRLTATLVEVLTRQTPLRVFGSLEHRAAADSSLRCGSKGSDHR